MRCWSRSFGTAAAAIELGLDFGPHLLRKPFNVPPGIPRPGLEVVAGAQMREVDQQSGTQLLRRFAGEGAWRGFGVGRPVVRTQVSFS